VIYEIDLSALLDYKTTADGMAKRVIGRAPVVCRHAGFVAHQLREQSRIPPLPTD